MSPTQCRMGRAALNLTIRRFSRQAGVAPNTVMRFEMGYSVYPRSLDKMRQTLLDGGVVLLEGDGVRLKS